MTAEADDPGVDAEGVEEPDEQLASEADEDLLIEASKLAVDPEEALARYPELDDSTFLMEQIQILQRRLQERQKEVENLRDTVAGLTEEIDRARPDREQESRQPRIEMRQLFTSLADAVEGAKVELRDLERVEGSEGVDITDLEIELRGGIDISQEAPRFVQLRDERVGPESVSTLRFRLRPRTNIHIAGSKDNDRPSEE